MNRIKLVIVGIIICLSFSLNVVKSQSCEENIAFADSLMQRRNFESAAPIYEKALEQCEHSIDTYIKVLNGLGRTSIFAYETERAKEFLEKAATFIKDKKGENSLEYAAALQNYGTFYHPSFPSNNPELCEKYILQSMEIRKKIVGENHSLVASNLNILAALYDDLGQFSKSEPMYLKAIEIQKNTLGEKHPIYAQSLNNIGVLYWNLSKYDLTEKYYLQALKIREEVLGTENMDYTQSLLNLGGLYSYLGSYSQAESFLLKAISIRSKLLGPTHQSLANPLLNLGSFYDDIGRYSDSETVYLQCLEIIKSNYSEEHPDFARILNIMGVLYINMKQYKKAESHILRANQIWKKLNGEENALYALGLYNLGSLYLKQEKIVEADSLLTKSLKIKEKVLGKEHKDYIISTEVLGTVKHFQNKTSEALVYLENANEYFQRNFQEQHHGRIDTKNNLSNIYWDSGAKEKALLLKEEIIKIVLKLPQQYFAGFSEKEQETIYRQFIHKYIEEYYAFSINSPLGRTGFMFDIQLSTKALLLKSSQKMKNNILNSGDTSLINTYWQWVDLKKEIVSVMNLSEDEREKENISLEALQKSATTLEKRLSAASSLFSDVTDQTSVRWQDIQKQLKKNEAAVEVIRVKNYGNISNDPEHPIANYNGLTDSISYVALIVKSNSKAPEIVVLPNGNELENKYMYTYKNSIYFKLEDTDSYYQYWLPISNKLKGIEKIYFSPDGIYHQINLNSIQNPKNKKFLMDEIHIESVTNTKDIVYNASNKVYEATAVLVGYPIYDLSPKNDAVSLQSSSSQGRAFRSFDSHISLLPGTQKEIQEIQKCLSKATFQTQVYLAEQSTEENVKAIKNTNILHISTHGYFIEPSKDGNDIDPMLRSGLLLTGVSSYARAAEKPEGEDGILTAQEASNLELEGTSLVVLAACETGLGDLKVGEGVYGLQRAFKVAGAKQVLMSLWKIDDHVTQKLMTLFYQNLVETSMISDSFRKAVLQIRKEHPHPYYWGAFVLIGG